MFVRRLIFAALSVRSLGLETGHYVFSSATCTNDSAYAWVFDTEIEVLSLNPFEIYPHPCEATNWTKTNETANDEEAGFTKDCFGVALNFAPHPLDEEQAILSFTSASSDALSCNFTLEHEHEEGEVLWPSKQEEEHVEISATTWLSGIAATILLSLVSLVGAIGILGTNNWAETYKAEMLGLSAGTLIGATIFLILPEAYEILGLRVDVGIVVVCGVMVGHLLEVLHPHQSDDDDSWIRWFDHSAGGKGVQTLEDHEARVEDPDVEMEQRTDTSSPQGTSSTPSKESDGIPPLKTSISSRLVMVNLLADALHNFVDGVLVAAAFASSASLGITTSLTVLAHEFPQELSDFNLILAAGYSVKSAAGLNLLVGSTAVLGAIMTFAVAGEDIKVEWCLPFSAGLFLYLALTGVIPTLSQMRANSNKSASNFRLLLPIFIGLVITGLLKLLPHAHGDHAGEEGGHEGHGH